MDSVKAFEKCVGELAAVRARIAAIKAEHAAAFVEIEQLEADEQRAIMDIKAVAHVTGDGYTGHGWRVVTTRKTAEVIDVRALADLRPDLAGTVFSREEVIKLDKKKLEQAIKSGTLDGAFVASITTYEALTPAVKIEPAPVLDDDADDLPF